MKKINGARTLAQILIGLMTLTAGATIAEAASPEPKLNLRIVAPVQQPTALATRSGDETLYVAQQTGTVVAIAKEKIVEKPILDLSDRITSGGEQGLLGLVFSPAGDKMYVNYSGKEGETVIEEFAFRAKKIKLASRRTLLTVEQPQPNHNGGQIEFGPDGMLYIGLGDGGGAGDKGDGHALEGNGQSQQTFLGKILRIDPQATSSSPYTIPTNNPFTNKSGKEEIFILGVRNPWRFSFDKTNNDMWISDVGENEREEITRVKFADAAGSNLGWPVFEGTRVFREVSLPGATPPDIEMTHQSGNCSVVGGFVYRGKMIPDLDGTYLFSDFCQGTIYGVKTKPNGKLSQPLDLKMSSEKITSFGQDNQGNLYVLSQSQGILAIEKTNQ